MAKRPKFMRCLKNGAIMPYVEDLFLAKGYEAWGPEEEVAEEKPSFRELATEEPDEDEEEDSAVLPEQPDPGIEPEAEAAEEAAPAPAKRSRRRRA